MMFHLSSNESTGFQFAYRLEFPPRIATRHAGYGLSAKPRESPYVSQCSKIAALHFQMCNLGDSAPPIRPKSAMLALYPLRIS